MFVARHVRKVAGLAVGAAFLLSIAPVSSQLAGAATNVSAVRPATKAPMLAYQAEAYGTSVKVGNVLTSGPTADVVLGCTLRAGVTRSDTTGAVTLPGLTTGAVSNVVSSAAVGGNPTASASSTITGIDLAGGAVTATAVSSDSQTSYAGGLFSTSGATTLVGLTVAGQTLAANPAPNTRIPLPGIGVLILNRQSGSVTASGASLIVEAIDLKVTVANSLGLGLGTEIVVGHARSDLPGTTSGVMGGVAFGTSLTGDGIAGLGRTAPVYLPCQGTGGVTITNTTVGITTPLVSTGQISSAAEGDILPAGPQATLADTISNVDLVPGVLGSLLSVSAVTASASATVANGTTTLSEAGSQFVGLSVAGFPLLTDNVPANTVLPILGVGTLYLNRVIETPHRIIVRMIELVLNVSLDGDPAGTDLIISEADAMAH